MPTMYKKISDIVVVARSVVCLNFLVSRKFIASKSLTFHILIDVGNAKKQSSIK